MLSAAAPVGESGAFDFGPEPVKAAAVPAPSPAARAQAIAERLKGQSPSAAPARPASTASPSAATEAMSPAAADALRRAPWHWTPATPTEATLRPCEAAWDTIFGPNWREYLQEALQARSDGEVPEALAARIGAAHGHYPSSILGLLLGAGLIAKQR